MASEPNKPIEDLLNASARARREEFGSDPQMPNPMRTRLHDEIERLAKEDERSTTRGFSFSWPRLIIGAAVAALLISVPIIWLRHSSPQTIQLAIQQPPPNDSLTLSDAAGAKAGESFNLAAAKAERDKQPELAKPAGLEIASAPSEPASRAGAALALPESSTERTEAKRATQEPVEAERSIELAKSNARAAVGAKPASQARAKSSDDLEKLAESRNTPVPETTAGATFNATQQFTKGMVASAPAQKTGTNSRQQFAQVPANQSARFAARAKPVANVLSSFQLEQNGTQIKVVDADGSTYTGEIEQISRRDSRSLANQSRNYSAPAEAGVARRDKDADQDNPEFYFRASGYNTSLRRNLVFEGNYVSASQQGANRVTEASKNKQQLAPGGRIIGTVKMSGEKPGQVDAISVTQ